MRPEYIEAVEGARQGWFVWGQLLPTLIIWWAAFRLKNGNGAVAVSVAFLMSWLLLVSHSNHVQATKRAHAVTVEELDDVGQDTWNTLAAASAIPYSFIYCALNVVAAYPACGIARLVRQIWRRRERQVPAEVDYESYRDSLVEELRELRGDE